MPAGSGGSAARALEPRVMSVHASAAGFDQAPKAAVGPSAAACEHGLETPLAAPAEQPSGGILRCLMVTCFHFPALNTAASSTKQALFPAERHS